MRLFILHRCMKRRSIERLTFPRNASGQAAVVKVIAPGESPNGEGNITSAQRRRFSSKRCKLPTTLVGNKGFLTKFSRLKAHLLKPVVL